MFFINKQYLPKIERNFSPEYFIEKNQQYEFKKNGFIILKDVISDNLINEALKHFDVIKEMKGYEVKDKFESTGNFSSKEIQQSVFDFVQRYITKVTINIFDTKNCEIGDGGAFFIKPTSNEKSILHPHQDSAVIDESKFYGIFVWIPLQDITPKNGALYILKGSHLWGNHYRSQHIEWAFRKHNNLLWEKMIPLYVKKGDILFFDTSIIHASSSNYSNDERLAVCGAILPKNHQKVEYKIIGKQTFLYNIDLEYWLDGGKEQSLKSYSSEKIENHFPNPINKYNVQKLLNNY